jgi:hypothetical protein
MRPSGGSMTYDDTRLTLRARSSQCGGGDTAPPTVPNRASNSSARSSENSSLLSLATFWSRCATRCLNSSSLRR